ncbi:unnamed protein product [Rhodiola kirilowii]
MHRRRGGAGMGGGAGGRARRGASPTAAGLLGGSSNFDSGTNSEKSVGDWIVTVGEALSTAFPVWVAVGCLLGLVRPSAYDWVQPKWTVAGITFTMLGMGMTLTFDDLGKALAMPKEILAGFFLQYSVMPVSGFLVSKLLNLPPHYAAGLILVACCPGGTASNIVTYIARGNVALSVLMTAASTFSAVIMTPFLTAKLAGQYVAVDAVGLLKSTMQVVLLPVLAGALLNQYSQRLVRLVSPLMPPIAVATVAVLCGHAIAQSSSAILMSGRQIALAVFLLHSSGFFFGYMLSRILGIDISSCRTISIEVGMQNSVLGVVLATQHFGNPLTAVPCAVSVSGFMYPNQSTPFPATLIRQDLQTQSSANLGFIRAMDMLRENTKGTISLVSSETNGLADLLAGKASREGLEIIEAVIMADSLDNVGADFLAKWARRRRINWSRLDAIPRACSSFMQGVNQPVADPT